MTRRSLLALLTGPLVARILWPERFRRQVLDYLEAHRRPGGGYGWSSDAVGQLTPTFAVIGCYRALGVEIPDAPRVAAFIRDNFPVPERRRAEKDRPLRRLDFEQVQSLLWLNQSVESFRRIASMWTAPPVMTPRYELHSQPVLQHQAMTVHIRHLLKLSPSDQDTAWREYFQSRRRPDGTFNSTPASDGAGGHVMNTYWGLMAAEHLGMKLPPAPGLAEWVRSCQTASGGFTYSPAAKLGAVDDLAYTWSALQILAHLAAAAPQREQCAAWIESLQTSEGGFQDRPEGEPNPIATLYALSCFQLLDHTPRSGVTPAPRAKAVAAPDSLNVYGIQIEAPGKGSPRDAVLLAGALGIHLWAAKNTPEGWIEEARHIAKEQNTPVTFASGDEEYGTYYGVAGLGCYSHLVDIVAPHGSDFGKPVPKTNHPYSFEEFRDLRIKSLHRGGGRLVWQCNDNEEFTRIVLDEAVKTQSYAAIASYHFGPQNFAHTYPYLYRWYGRLPFVGLLDSHTAETWWWGDQLSGQKTLFLAKQPDWDGWLQALDRNWVVSVRHDASTDWKTQMMGGPAAVREYVLKYSGQWSWWDDAGRQNRRPAAALACLMPGMRFEAGAPAADAHDECALRLRMWHDNSQQGQPLEPRAELVALRVDDQVVSTLR